MAGLQKRHELHSFQLAAVAVVLGAVAALLGVVYAPNACGMSYSYPSYAAVTLPPQERPSPYTLYAYSETGGPGFRTEPQLAGVPVLFVPGSGGSYRQVRSVASESCKQHNAFQRGRVLDWYAADFQEELSGMDGNLLARQTAFVVHAMQQLDRMYGAAGNSAPVILLGHSMGGLVARAAVVHPECPPGVVGAVLTLAAPHITSPWLGQLALRSFYVDTNSRWRVRQVGKGAVPLAALSAGVRDVQVPDWLSRLHDEPFTVASSTADLPDVRLSMDHQCIMWCNQVVVPVAETLLELSAGPGVERSDAAAAYRQAVLQRRFQPSSTGQQGHDAPLRHRVALWATVNLPRLPALCAAAAAAAAHQELAVKQRAGGDGRLVTMVTFVMVHRALALAVFAGLWSKLNPGALPPSVEAASMLVLHGSADAIVMLQLRLCAVFLRVAALKLPKQRLAPACIIVLGAVSRRVPLVACWLLSLGGQLHASLVAPARGSGAVASQASSCMLLLLCSCLLCALPAGVAWVQVLAAQGWRFLPVHSLADSAVGLPAAAYGVRQLVWPSASLPLRMGTRGWAALYVACTVSGVAACPYGVTLAGAVACIAASVATSGAAP